MNSPLTHVCTKVFLRRRPVTNDRISLYLDYCIRIKTIKTGTEATLPISYDALSLCGEPGEGKV